MSFRIDIEILSTGNRVTTFRREIERLAVHCIDFPPSGKCVQPRAFETIFVNIRNFNISCIIFHFCYLIYQTLYYIFRSFLCLLKCSLPRSFTWLKYEWTELKFMTFCGELRSKAVRCANIV